MTLAHQPDTPCTRLRSTWLTLLTWSFTLFNTARVLAYLPTLWALQAHGDSSQHSLWTWCTWLGANATMALWLWEGNARRLNPAICVNALNAAMCAWIVATIVGLRMA